MGDFNNKGSSTDKDNYYNKDQTTTTTTNGSPYREGSTNHQGRPNWEGPTSNPRPNWEGPTSNPRPNYGGPPNNNHQGSNWDEPNKTWDSGMSLGSTIGNLFNPFNMRVFSGLLGLVTGRGETARQVNEMARQVNEGSMAFNERAREFQQASQGVDQTSRNVGERVREVRETGRPFQHTVTQKYEDKVGNANYKVTREKTVKITPGRNY